MSWMRERRAKRAARERRAIDTATMNIFLRAAKTMAEMTARTKREVRRTLLYCRWKRERCRDAYI